MIYPEYNEKQRYPREKTIGFTSTKAEWGILCNFSTEAPITWNDITFDCAERMYHWLRLSSSEAREEYLKERAGMNLKMKAKSFKKKGLERKDWTENAVDALRFSLQLKYEQNENFRKALARTDDRFIVEDQTSRPRKTPDSWGAKYDATTDTYYGKNIMGRLLMELRNKGVLSNGLPESYLTNY